MKFLVYVDPASAMRAGNERIREQYVDVDLKTLTEAERLVVSRAQILSNPDAIDLRRHENGLRNADVETVVLDEACEASVRKLITAIVDANRDRAEAKVFVETHMQTVGEFLIDKLPVERFFVNRRDEELVTDWLQKNFPDLDWTFDEDESHDPYKKVVSNIIFKMKARITDQTAMPEVRAGHYLWPQALALIPEHTHGRDLMKHRFEQMTTGFSRRELPEWAVNRLARNRASSEADFLAELDARRDEFASIVDNAKEAARKLDDNYALVEKTLAEASAKQPGLAILDRYEQDLLPELEFMAILRDAAFSALSDLKRFKRIDDSEVKKRKSEMLEYKVYENSEVKAKFFHLANKIATLLPAAKVEHVVHRALVDTECRVERDAVRATVEFAGFKLSREYVPD